MTRTMLAAMGLAAVLAGPVAAQTYDAAAAFGNSITATGTTVTASSNPNGVWSYRYAESLTDASTTASMAAFVSTQNVNIEGWQLGSNVPGLYYNTSGTQQDSGSTRWLANELIMHPGSSKYSVLRFTSPATDTYTLSATVTGASLDAGGATTDAHVFVNGVESFAAVTVSGYRGNSGGGFSSSNLPLAAGDTVELRLGSNGTFGSDSTGVSFVIAPVPEPATVLTVAAVGLVAVRRRQLSGR